MYLSSCYSLDLDNSWFDIKIPEGTASNLFWNIPWSWDLSDSNSWHIYWNRKQSGLAQAISPGKTFTKNSEGIIYMQGVSSRVKWIYCFWSGDNILRISVELSPNMRFISSDSQKEIGVLIWSRLPSSKSLLSYCSEVKLIYDINTGSSELSEQRISCRLHTIIAVENANMNLGLTLSSSNWDRRRSQKWMMSSILSHFEAK